MSAGWLEDNGLTVTVGELRPRGHLLFEGEKELRHEARIQLVWVTSHAAGGQVRGYVVAEGERLLRLWLPDYCGDWPEMDAAVCQRLGMERWRALPPAGALPGQMGLFGGGAS